MAKLRSRMLCAGVMGVALTGAVVIGAPDAQAVEPGLSAEVSYEKLKLPGTQLTYIFNNVLGQAAAPNGVVSKDQNHDGKVDGARYDLSWGSRTSLFGGVPIVWRPSICVLAKTSPKSSTGRSCTAQRPRPAGDRTNPRAGSSCLMSGVGCSNNALTLAAPLPGQR